MDKLYTISEVADKLGLSTKTLRRWEETGKFIGTRTLGNQRRYTLVDLQILDAIKHGTVSGSDDLLTIDQAAQLFGVTPSTIARWENDGKIHPLITAGATFYPRHRLLSQMDQLQALAPPPVEAIPSPPTPVDLSPRRPLSPLPSSQTLAPSPPSLLLIVAVNTLITVLLLALYHFAFASPQLPTSPAATQIPTLDPTAGWSAASPQLNK